MASKRDTERASKRLCAQAEKEIDRKDDDEMLASLIALSECGVLDTKYEDALNRALPMIGKAIEQKRKK